MGHRAKRSKPVGMYIYCSEDEKKRIDNARRQVRRTLSGYVLDATLRQVERDERRQRTGSKPPR